MASRRIVEVRRRAKAATALRGGAAEGSRRNLITLRSGEADDIVARARAAVSRLSDVPTVAADVLSLALEDGAPTPLGVLRAASPALVDAWMGGGAGWARLGVEGDGSCLYHCIAAHLNLDGYWGADVAGRRGIAERFRCALTSVSRPEDLRALRATMAHSADAPPPPLDSGIVPLEGLSDGAASAVLARQLCTPSVWADEPEIRLLLRALGLNAIFIDTASTRASQPYCGVHGDAARMPTCIVVWCNRRQHFEPLVRVARGSVRTLLLPSRTEDVRPIQAVMARYWSACD